MKKQAMETRDAKGVENAAATEGAEDPSLWFVVRSKSGDEGRVVSNLSNQGLQTLLPLIEEGRFIGGKWVKRIKPLFPSYLFARFSLGSHFAKVRWTRGVQKVLGTREGPVPISEAVIQIIRERMGEDRLVKLDDDLEEGSRVKVTQGPFKDLLGVFQKKMSDKGRVRILLDLVGVDIPVQLARWQIRKMV
jgi:transcriptional antiterminator RfaH